MKLKKFIAAVLSTVMLDCAVCYAVPDAQVNLTVYGTEVTGDGLNYSKHFDHVVIEASPEYTSSELNIPAEIDGLPVWEIADKAFYERELTAVTFPETLTTIGEYAFSRTNIETLTLPNSVTDIGEYAFSECHYLQSAYISDGITEIADSVFRGDSALQSVTLPSELKNIGSYAFSSCRALTNIKFPDSLEAIGWDSFWYCESLKEVILPKRCRTIESEAFANTGVERAVITGLTEIHSSAFAYSALQEIEGEKNCCFKGVGKHPFVGTPWEETQLKQSPFLIFGDTLLDAQNAAGDITIPPEVNLIYARAFYENTNIGSVDMNHVVWVGSYAFYGSSVTEVNFRDVTWISGYAFGDCDNLTAVDTRNAGLVYENAFNDCSNLQTVYTSADELSALNGKIWTESGWQSDYDGVFFNCGVLRDVVLLNPYCKIFGKSGIFCNAVECDTYGSRFFKGTIYGEDYSFRYNIQQADGTYYLSPKKYAQDFNRNFVDIDTIVQRTEIDGVTYAKRDGFWTVVKCDPTKSGAVEIPAQLDGLPVTYIGPDAFYNCTDVTAVILPESITGIGQGAFENCRNLETINIPSKVRYLPSWTFSNCDSLQEITLPAGMIGIGNAFEGESLRTITIPSSVRYIAQQGSNSGSQRWYERCNWTINCSAGSAAQIWAENYGIPYTLIDEVMGDVNTDGVCSVADVILLQKWLLAIPDTNLANWKAADLSTDGKLDAVDLCLMKRELLNQS